MYWTECLESACCGVLRTVVTTAWKRCKYHSFKQYSCKIVSSGVICGGLWGDWDFLLIFVCVFFFFELFIKINLRTIWIAHCFCCHYTLLAFFPLMKWCCACIMWGKVSERNLWVYLSSKNGRVTCLAVTTLRSQIYFEGNFSVKHS